jgi:hypothetical protein
MLHIQRDNMEKCEFLLEQSTQTLRYFDFGYDLATSFKEV